MEQSLRMGKVKEFRQYKPDRIQYCLMKAIICFSTGKRGNFWAHRIHVHKDV